MKKNSINNIKLGIFIIAGLFILVVSLYLIGKNQHFFGSNFVLKARFHNVEGLMPGNNVRFSGIQCGTVKDIEIINDTTIEVTMLPSKYAIEQNYPNPFNPVTTINFSLPEDSKVKISIYNVMGEKVAEPYNSTTSAGYNQVTFNATGLASGVYYYRIEAAATGSGSEFTAVKKMILLK